MHPRTNTPGSTSHHFVPLLLLLGLSLLVLSLLSGLVWAGDSDTIRSAQAAHPEHAGSFSRQLPPSCADGANDLRLFQTPVPVTPEPSPTTDPDSPTATPAPPTATPLPAPSEDRIGFSEGYPQEFRLLFLFDRPDNKQVRVICGNAEAASRQPGEPFPYGSELVMETWQTLQDENGNPILDENGHYIRSRLTGIFVQRKEPGFGEAYQENRSGEWEYVAYRPDGETFIPPDRTANCAICHQSQAGSDVDFVFRMDLYHRGDEAQTPPEVGENEVNIFIYDFLPTTLTVKPGTTVTWVNNDEANHIIESRDGLFSSEVLRSVLVTENGPDTFSYTFDEPGTYEYFCSIHPAMAGTIEVIE